MPYRCILDNNYRQIFAVTHTCFGYCLYRPCIIIYPGMFDTHQMGNEHEQAIADLVNKFSWVFLACTIMSAVVLIQLMIFK